MGREICMCLFVRIYAGAYEKPRNEWLFAFCNELMQLLATVCESNAAWAQFSVF